MADDPALRSHLHHLLFDYVQTHLATDYTQHTASELSRVSNICGCFGGLPALSCVSKIFGAFTIAPEQSSSFVTIPVDPLHGYLSRLGVQTILPDESWQVNTGAMEHLRQNIRALAYDRTPMTESCWSEQPGCNSFV